MKPILYTIAASAVLAVSLFAATRNTMKENPTTQPTTAPAACSIDGASSCGTTPWTGKSDEELRRLLTPEQYQIARQSGTERAFAGKYWNTHTPGVYQCAVCGQPLFSSQTKFDSGTGWPSFFKPLADKALTTINDRAHGMVRTEVRCSQCASHLGHVFEDGPAPTHLRYCMNSAVLNLVPDEKQPAEKK